MVVVCKIKSSQCITVHRDKNGQYYGKRTARFTYYRSTDRVGLNRELHGISGTGHMV